MFDKIVITLLGLIMALVSVNTVNKNNLTFEHFGMLPSFQVKLDREVAPSMAAAQKGQFYSVPGQYQAILNPRFSNVNYGSAIRYNFPSEKNQAVPRDPLTFNRMAKENYSALNQARRRTNVREGYEEAPQDDNGVARCRPGGIGRDFHYGAPIVEADYAAGNFNELRDKAYQGSDDTIITSALPVGDMTSMSTEGDVEQPIVYDRYIYANRNSRLRAQGDPIRGDLPIIPDSNDNQWFKVSVAPSVDLQFGAMNVIGGTDNETANALAQMVYASSGGAQDTVNGISLSSQTTGTLAMGQRDINFTAFP